MWAGFSADPDAEHRSGAYGSGMEEEFAKSQDPVSRQILGVHPQRHGRPRAGRPGDRPRSTDHRRHPVQFVLEDVLNGFDPFLGLGQNRSADDSFQRLTYGGYLMRQGLSQSVPTRIKAVRTMERQLLVDISHPGAFKNSGKFHTALLDEADFAMNR